MKRIIFLTFTFASLSYAAYFLTQPEKPIIFDERQPPTRAVHDSAICVVFYQDVSGSITSNGVEIVSSSVFTPYFENVDRDILLNFGIIDNLTAEKLIVLKLPKKNFNKPILADLKKMNVTEARREKERYIKANKQYTEDSLKFYEDRKHRIAMFQNKVDALLAPYNINLSGQTDLITSIDIADKVFEYSDFGPTKNFVFLNSDGLDSYNRKVSKLENRAEVILINAGQKIRTSVDAVITKRLQSPEQAIQYTLRH